MMARGRTADRKPIARPAMMFVGCVSLSSARRSTVLARGEVLGREADAEAGEQAGDDAAGPLDGLRALDVSEDDQGQHEDQRGEHHGGEDRALAQRGLGIAPLLHAHREDTEDRGEDAHGEGREHEAHGGGRPRLRRACSPRSRSRSGWRRRSSRRGRRPCRPRRPRCRRRCRRSRRGCAGRPRGCPPRPSRRGRRRRRPPWCRCRRRRARRARSRRRPSRSPR